MFKRSLYSALLLSISISTDLFSQQAESPRVIPPSPAMTPFMRYGEYPVGHATGLVDIKIPLYEIRIKDFVFPIDISFHASGRRADMEFSSMGVGWSMNTGYMSREIRERPDELSVPIENTVGDLTYTNGQYDILKAYNNLIPADITIPAAAPGSFYLKDTEHDMYSYQVNGMSGKFVQNALGNAMPLTAVSYKVGFKILIDEKGVKYEFGGPDALENTVVRHNNRDEDVTTGWYLKKITLLSGEIIEFNYGSRYTGVSTDDIVAPDHRDKDLTYGQVDIYDPIFRQGAGGNNPLDWYWYSGLLKGFKVNDVSTRRDYGIHYLTSVQFNGNRINFSYDDITLKLLDMEVRNEDNERLKYAAFTYINTPGTTGNFQNNNSKSLSRVDMGIHGRYDFEYYNDPLLYSSSAYVFQTKTDWWGYSNEEGDRVPAHDMENPPTGGYGCTNCRKANFYNKRSGMLKRIVYPTKGNTEFIYEPNFYIQSNTGVTEEGPGLRIRTLINDYGQDKKDTVNYRYGLAENGIGTLLHMPHYRDFREEKIFVSVFTGGNMILYGGSFNIRNYNIAPLSQVAEGYRQPVYYSRITEYRNSSNRNENGKIVYTYSTPQSSFNILGTAGTFRLKDWTSPKLLYKDTYKGLAQPNSYQPVLSEGTEYITLKQQSIPQIKMRRRWSIPYEDGSFTYRPREMSHAGINGNEQRFGFPFEIMNNPIESAVELPSAHVSTSYGNGTSVSTRTNYYYDNLAHLKPTRTETFTSTSDEKQLEEIRYAQDYVSPGVSNGVQMGIRNMQSKYVIAPVEVSEYKIGPGSSPKRLLKSSLYAYNSVKPALDSLLTIESENPLTDFVPLTIPMGVMSVDSRYLKKYTYLYDDRLNLIQETPILGASRSYIWGYDKMFPIAGLNNAQWKDVFYDDFESPGSGGTYRSTNDSYTGRYCNLYGYSKSLTGLKNGSYTLAYWKKESTGAWSSVVQDNINVSGGNYQISIPSSYKVDDVRFHPMESNMTTYTYKPLLGITSATDAKGMTTYYEYDNTQRLKHIKDQKGNIIKSYEYHFKP